MVKLGKSPDGVVGIDAEMLLRQRLLVTASSGGGKTKLITKLCEACFEQFQIIIIDPEGEFAPLRANYPFVLAGKDGETPATVASASLLATRLLELQASAICDIYELPPHQRHEFVRNFITALIDAPKDLWPSTHGRGLLVLVDEAHLFCPEKGQGESVASAAMNDLASRGRKRGLCGIFATQRLAKIQNNLISECQNRLVGLTTQENQERSANMLHIVGKVPRNDFFKEVGRLPAGDFYAYGPAFGSHDPIRFHADLPKTAVATTIEGLAPVAPPTPAAIKKLLPQLSDLPQEAEKKAKTEAELRAELATANRTIRDLQTATPSMNEEALNMLKEKLEELAEGMGKVEEQVKDYRSRFTRLKKIVAELGDVLSEEEVETAGIELIRPLEQDIRRSLAQPTAPRIAPRKPVLSGPSDVSLPLGERKVLTVLAQYPDGLQRGTIGVYSGYTAKSTRDAYIQRLMAKDYVASNGTSGICITGAGLTALGSYEPLPTGSELLQWWLNQLPKGEAEVLTALTKGKARFGLSRDEIGEATGYSAKSTRDAYIQRLAAKLLVKSMNGMIVPDEGLFD